MKKLAFSLITFAAVCFGMVVTHPVAHTPPSQQQSLPQQKTPGTPNISVPIPGHLSYSQIVSKLQEWNLAAPDLTEVGFYGKTSRGQDIVYLKITNKYTQGKPKVLIAACIHGNEPLSTAVVMAYTGTILSGYGKDKEITDLVNTREIYIVPVFSPDSFPSSRHVDGVDPNRDFPGPRNSKTSVAPVAAIQRFFQEKKFNAVISSHTSGRVFLTPYGDNMALCPNNTDFDRIIGQMASMCQYRKIRACQVYRHPIYGSEIDWYYRSGAFSIVMEMGTHQSIPSMQDTQVEFNRTYKGVLFFMKEAPLVNISGKTLLDNLEGVQWLQRNFQMMRQLR